MLSSTALLKACGRREEPVRLTTVLVLILVAFATLQPTRLCAGVDAWTSSGPGQPYVDRVFANPFRPGRLVVGALITTDGGVTWSHSGLDANYSEYGSVIFDGLSPDTMLRLALNRPGLSVGQEPLPQVLWRTTDRGTSWYPSATGVIGAVASRSRPGLIYATHPDRLFVSTNGGRSWETRDPLGSWPKTVGDRFSNRYEMAISGEKNDTVWVAGNSGLVRSTDGGWTWVDAGFAGQRISVLLAAGPDDGVVLAGDGTALWRSTDGGASWKITGPTGINRVVVHPTDSSTLYAVASGHLYRSSTAGLLWAEVSTSPWGADVAVSPGDPETLFLACGDNGLLMSQDLGLTWNPVKLGYYRSTRCFAVDPQNSSTIWASAPDLYSPAFYRSEDSGGHWIRTPSPLYIRDLAVPNEPSAPLYAAGGQHPSYGIYKSIDRGDSWQPIKEGASYYARVYVAPGNSDVVYVTDEYSDAGRIYRSRNAGVDWKLLNQGLITWGLAIDPSDSDRLLAGTAQGLLLSVNGGDSWSPVTALASLAISSVAFHPRLAGVAFAATPGSAAARGRLYRSENGGNNWSLLNEVAGVLEGINRIRFDPLSDDILYVTSGYYLYKVSATEVGGPRVRFAPPRYDWIRGLELTGGERTTLHVALDGRGVYSLTPVSDQRCDFEIVEIGPREFTPDSVILTLQVTNHGPADYVGEVRVQNEFRGRVTSVECPGLTNRWMEGSFDSWLELTLDGAFPAGESRRIRITRLGERKRGYWGSLPIVSTVTPTLPVELDQSNNTSSIILTEPAARRGGASRNRPERPVR